MSTLIPPSNACTAPLSPCRNFILVTRVQYFLLSLKISGCRTLIPSNFGPEGSLTREWRVVAFKYLKDEILILHQSQKSFIQTEKLLLKNGFYCIEFLLKNFIVIKEIFTYFIWSFSNAFLWFWEKTFNWNSDRVEHNS